jgi:hypothetical protein
VAHQEVAMAATVGPTPLASGGKGRRRGVAQVQFEKGGSGAGKKFDASVTGGF